MQLAISPVCLLIRSEGSAPDILAQALNSTGALIIYLVESKSPGPGESVLQRSEEACWVWWHS